MSLFPADLMHDILSRLPVKTLLRFKCVSKPWGSLIDDSDFAKHHLHHSLKSNTNVKLFLDNCVEVDDKAYSVDFDLFDNLVQIPRPFTAETDKYCSRIFGSCNGLLAVYHREAGIALWNPTTRKCHYLPSLDDDLTLDHDTPILGFGYDATKNDYKVVKMLRSKTQNCFKVMVYSLKANSWRRIMDCPFDFPTNIPTNYNDGAYLNNSLHWVGNKRGVFYGGNVIFALDLGIEEYYEVPKGDTNFGEEECGGCSAYFDFAYLNAGVLGGCLCVSLGCSACPVEDHINFWVMEEYGVKESWIKLLYLSEDRWQTSLSHTRAVAYSRNGDKILLDGGCCQPAWFNLMDGTEETLFIPGAPQLFSTMIYVESLVPVN
ncbi:hypothetical protein PTKIN_Ptkin13bG0131200 [Pterospermum kingtungense]